MSLLLDALKKAAEQKARQTRVEPGGSDVDQVREDISDSEVLRAEEKTVLIDDKTLQHEDRTEIIEDRTEIVDRTEVVEDRTEIIEAPTHESAGDSTTSIEATEIIKRNDNDAYRDDTQILSNEVVVDEPGEPGRQTIETSADDLSGHVDNERNALDDTLISKNQAELAKEVFTDSSQPDEKDDTIQSALNTKETAAGLSSRDVADFMDGSPDAAADDSPGDEYHRDDSSVSDMSLHLMREHDDTTENSKNDDTVLSAGAHISGYSGHSETESLQLVNDAADSATNLSAITADQSGPITGGVELESLRHEHTVMRPDVTSTHTYAPDNYDRTLMRPPSDDASKIFAGMKADDDVLMTPDYAKRVFLSKSSANRMQHYKIYLGIAISVFLAIGIYSMYELLNEYNRIDTAMMPLKRDPLPGIIQQGPKQGEIKLFENTVQPDVDTQTLKLVENAQTVGLSGEAVIEDSENNEVSNSSELSNDSDETSDNQQLQQNTDSLGVSEVTGSQVVARVEQAPKPAETVAAKTSADNTEAISSGSLQISSSSRLNQIDQWLSDAFAAYQRGDDATALQNYARVLQEDPTNRNALLANAAIKVQNGNTVSAIADYQQLLHANPKDSLAMSSLISIAHTAPRESESQLKLMIRDEPESPHLNFVLANLYGAQNRWQEAQSLYFKALENKPEDPNYAYNLAVSLEHIAKPKAAITYYERAIANIRNGLATFNRDLVDNRIEMLKQL